MKGWFMALGLMMMGPLYAEEVIPKKEVIVGISPYYQPFEFRRGTEIIGFDVDLIRAIAAQLGWSIQFKEVPFEEIMSALKNHDIDLAISGINMIPDRLKEIDFSQSYHQPHSLVWVFLPGKSSPDQAVSNVKVGVQKGTYLQEWVNNQQKIKMNIQSAAYSSTPELFEKLNSREVDAIVVEEIQAIQYNQTFPGKILFQSSESMIEGYGVAFPKGSPLTKDVNLALQKLTTSGVVKTLREKWIP